MVIGWLRLTLENWVPDRANKTMLPLFLKSQILKNIPCPSRQPLNVRIYPCFRFTFKVKSHHWENINFTFLTEKGVL